MRHSRLSRSIVRREHLERPGRVARLGAPGAGAPLVELHERPGAAPVPRRGRLGLYHYAILLPDRPALGRFLRHLAEIGERAGMSDHFVSEALYLTDPDGLGIEVYADRPRGAWRHEDRQLTMTTIPLDVEAVLAGRGRRALVRDAIRHGAGARAPVRGGSGACGGVLSCRPGTRQDRLELSRRAFPVGRRLPPPPRHQHLGDGGGAGGTGRGPVAGVGGGRAVVRDAAEAIASIAAAGGAVEHSADGGVARDPWGTAVRVRGVG